MNSETVPMLEEKTRLSRDSGVAKAYLVTRWPHA